MEFRVLGNLEVVIDGAPVDVGGTQPRTVLAMLLVAGGGVVRADALIDALWGDRPPDSAAGTLQSYMSRLRRALSPGARGEGAKVLVWEPPGYKLVIDELALDSRRFERGADRGRTLLAEGDPAQARAVLDEALALWRGPALLGLNHLDFAWGFAAKLEERRLVATENRIEADLRLGRHAAVVGELGELVAENPLREQFRHHLALALYRSGRQAEALRVLDDARRTLRQQLGIDPSRPLTDLEAAILAQDPSLNLTAPTPPPRPPPEPPAGLPSPPAPVTLPPPREAGGAGGGAAPGTAPAARPVPAGLALLGREIELRQALGALDEARDCTRVVLVEGEPGIGKTRLVEELAAAAAGRGTAVHWGRAFHAEVTPAFWPWLPPLRALVGELGAGAEVAPELARLVDGGSADGDDGGPAGATTAAPTDRSRFRFFDAVARLIADAAARRPRMLVLDDLHWADVPSLELLAFVAGQLTDEPVLLACTVRELEVGRNDAVVEALALLTRANGTRRITLGGISHLATAELVEAAAGRPVDKAITSAIQDRAEGNPFFATELARLVVSDDGGAGALGAVAPGGDVPSGVRDVVRRRLALLPGPTAEVLQVTAVIGREADLDLLVHASGVDVDTALDHLDPAVVHRLLGPVPDQPGTFRFAHGLVRDVVVDDMSALQRARVHLRVADALEATAGGLDDTAEILAEHLWSAAAIGAGPRAAAALERAAEVAVRRYAFESAEGLLERALQLQGTGQDPEAELRASSRLLSIQRSLYGYASVADSPHLRRAKDLARQADRPDVLARLLWTEWAAYDTRCDFARSEAIAGALHELGEGSDDPLVQVTGLASMGTTRWHRGDITGATALYDEAVRVGEAAIRPAMSLGLDLEVLLLPLPFSRYLHVLVGDGGDAAAAEAGFEALAAAAPDRFAVSVVETVAAGGALMVGEPAWAERAARRGIEADPTATFTFWGRALQAYLAGALIDQGEHAPGLALLDEAIEGFMAVEGRTGMAMFQASRAVGLTGTGRLDDAAAALADARSELDIYGERYGEPLVIEAEARFRHARGDDPAAVAARLAEGVALATTQGAHAVARRVAATAARLGLPAA
ncbi:MAG TPA: BTAD domain-containing putative transcriptional regulator [Acidimicrobiales bacterium]